MHGSMNHYCMLYLLVHQPVDEPTNPCNPSPCGANAVCKERNGAGSCSCLPEYQGDPYSGCRPECIMNSDCPRNRACSNQKCRDPCPGTCGINADCSVFNHNPTCTCRSGYQGNPLVSCHLPVQARKNISIVDLDQPRLNYSFLSQVAFRSTISHNPQRKIPK